MTNHIIEKVHNRNRPMPEVFERQDIRNSGGWDVKNVKAVRGEPFITVSGRIMRVPLDDSNLARAIRGHEQMHVKVSPQDLRPYINDVTPEGAIRSAEEARVNYIAKQLGFPMKDMITGSEKHDGELMVQTNSWTEAVYAVAASIWTGSLRGLLTGIRREAPVWADQLRDVAKEFELFQKKQIRNIKKRKYGVKNTPDYVALQTYGSTEISANNSSWIEGMGYTVEFAMLIESIATMEPPRMQKPQPQKQQGNTDSDENEANSEQNQNAGEQNGEEGSDENGEDNEQNQSESETNVDHEDGLQKDLDTQADELSDETDGTIDRQDIQNRAKKILNNSATRKGGIGDWLPVKLERVPLTINVQGSLGKKRVASNVGRNPRRIHRVLTDPERRIFDKKVKAGGGVVLIDCSGSMSLSKEQVKEIMMSAPGCTVIAYSCSWREDANTFIIADKGKICQELPYTYNGNGNDLPAIEYAVSLKQNSSAPVVWITDGMVYRPEGGSAYDELECAVYARKFGVHMEYNPEDAVEYLKGLQRGQKASPKILDRWQEQLDAYGRKTAIWKS